jgi:hypothetical protein
MRTTGVGIALAVFPMIGSLAGASEGPAVTFNKDIAPLVFRSCTPCHRPGEVAPFSLLNYAQASKRAKLIRDVVAERTMPPWKADGNSPHFADERKLTDAEVATITSWVEAGTPEGDPSDLPAAPQFATGWQLGDPDMIIKMPEAYSLSADGPDLYRCFVIPVQIPAGKYLKSVEFRPGNRKIVHHAVLTQLPHAMSEKKLKEGDGKSFASGLTPPGMLLPGQLAFWTPGMMPRELPEGLAAEWQRGVDLVLQLHLHPSGKPETEQSSIGFHFTEKKPTSRLRMVALSNDKLDIPAGQSDFPVDATRTIREAVDLYGIFPHMHLIGKSVNVNAKLPDGKTIPLININAWDFNWQNYYQYSKPIRLPAGTRLEGHFIFNNSAANPANPSTPPKRVTFGEQTADEMALVLMDVLPTAPPSPAAAGQDLEKRITAMVKKADKDGDGKLSEIEMKEAVAAGDLPRQIGSQFSLLDGNGDKQVTVAELMAAIKAMGGR